MTKVPSDLPRRPLAELLRRTPTQAEINTVTEWDEFGQGYIDSRCVVCICGEWLGEKGTLPSEHYCPANEDLEETT